MVVLVVCGSDRVIGNERASDCLACLMSAIVGLVRSRRTCDVCGSSGFGRLVYWNEFDSIGVLITVWNELKDPNGIIIVVSLPRTKM
jgi:hypothetical protein